jgi:hypothetical protein
MCTKNLLNKLCRNLFKGNNYSNQSTTVSDHKKSIKIDQIY